MSIKLRYIVFLLIAAVSIPLSAQSTADAERLFNAGDFEEAYSIYLAQLQRRPNDYKLKYRVGRSLYEMGRYEEAIPYFEGAENGRIERVYYYLAEAYFETYRFEKSANAMMLYLELMDGRIADVSEYQKKIYRAQLGASMIERVADVSVIDSVKLHKSQVLKGYRMQSDLGHIAMLDDSLTHEAEPQMVYYSGRNDRMFFAYDEGGNLDLRISYRLLGGWSDALALSEVLNTDQDENYPFVLPDGITIYFASKGHNSLGGYDIFMSRYNADNEDYMEPVNLGMPFNSPANDYLMVVDEITHTGWFATDRFQHSDSVVVYEFVYNATRRLLNADDYENPDYLRLAAQLKVYSEASYAEEEDNGEEGAVDNGKQGRKEIEFVVSDDIVYYYKKQFVSNDARILYEKVIETDNKLNTALILLDGKRRELMLSDNAEDRASLSAEIIQMESDVIKYKELLDEYVLQTRRAELKELNNQNK